MLSPTHGRGVNFYSDGAELGRDNGLYQRCAHHLSVSIQYDVVEHDRLGSKGHAGRGQHDLGQGHAEDIGIPREFSRERRSHLTWISPALVLASGQRRTQAPSK